MCVQAEQRLIEFAVEILRAAEELPDDADLAICSDPLTLISRQIDARRALIKLALELGVYARERLVNSDLKKLNAPPKH